MIQKNISIAELNEIVTLIQDKEYHHNTILLRSDLVQLHCFGNCYRIYITLAYTRYYIIREINSFDTTTSYEEIL